MSTKDKIKNDLLEISRLTDFQDSDQVYKYSEFIKEKIKNIFGFNHRITEKDILFTRARIHREKKQLFSNKAELWYPQKVKNIGRANFIGKPVFYCSNDPGTAIFEINPGLGQFITTLEVKIKKSQINLMYLGFNSQNTSAFNQIPESDQGLHEFMEIIFREKVNEGQEYNYLKTAILAQAFLTEADGIAYPSVGSECRGWNVVFPIDFIDNHAQIKKAVVHKVIEKSDPSNLRIECVYKSTTLTKNNDFIWTEISDCKTHLIDEYIYH